MTSFGEGKISDQKRLARGEHILAARNCLRVRDHTHHAKWRVMIMAGGNPSGEVTAIRELMPKAHITAVDRDPACLEAAISAGVDEVVEVDLTDYTRLGESVTRAPARPLVDLPKFDLVNLDLCAGPNPTTKRLIAVNRRLCASGGVMCVTFSYGRDVQEVFLDSLAKYRGYDFYTVPKIPHGLAGRLCYLFAGNIHALKSVIAYRGNEMPMCSVLLHGCAGRVVQPPTSFVQIEPGDFELAVVYLDAAKLYDCPADRIAAIRRSFSAQKAVATRRARTV